MAERSWVLTYRARPWLVNTERSGSKRGMGGHFGRAKKVEEWREAYRDLCTEQRVPPLQYIAVEALQVCRTRVMPDIGNCYPAVKAAIDGLVDAGVIPNDKGDPYLRSISFKPPVAVGYDALILRVTGPPCTPDERIERERAHREKLLRAAQLAS